MLVDAVPAEEGVHEGQATAFAPEGSLPDPHKHVSGLQILVPHELGDQARACMVVPGQEPVDEVIPHSVRVLKLLDLAGADRPGQRELGARHEPGREVVTLRMVEKDLHRDLADQPGHVLEVPGSGDLLAVPGPKHEVPEPHAVPHELPHPGQEAG